MIFSYRNGVLLTDNSEEKTVRENTKESSLEIKVGEKYLQIFQIPHLTSAKTSNVVFYLQLGMNLYVAERDSDTSVWTLYLIEQGVEYNKMKIKNIESHILFDESNPLYRYCVPAKANEKENIIVGVDEILSEISFISEKERNYLVEKIKEFFAEKKVEIEPAEKERVKKIRDKVYKGSGKGVRTPIIYKGKTYKNRRQFADAYNINYSTLQRVIERGMSLDDIIIRYSGNVGTGSDRTSNVPVTYNGVEYPSTTTFCKEFHIPGSTFTVAKKAGLSIEQIVERYSKNKRVRTTPTQSSVVEKESEV